MAHGYGDLTVRSRMLTGILVGESTGIPIWVEQVFTRNQAGSTLFDLSDRVLNRCAY